MNINDKKGTPTESEAASESDVKNDIAIKI